MTDQKMYLQSKGVRYLNLKTNSNHNQIYDANQQNNTKWNICVTIKTMKND